ncbi:MAG: hypothetical protein RL326_425, partial [Pseudomonadota bacterium]
MLVDKPSRILVVGGGVAGIT